MRGQPRGHPRPAGDEGRVADDIRLHYGPLQRLEAAYRAAHYEVYLLYAQIFAQKNLCIYDVTDRDPWESEIIRCALRILLRTASRHRGSRARGPVCGAEHVGAYYYIFVRVEEFTWPGKLRPPVCRVGIGSEGMGYPDRLFPARDSVQTQCP